MNNANRRKRAMVSFFYRCSLLILVSAGIISALSPEQQAWEILHAGLKMENTNERSIAVHVLGLLEGDAEAVKLAEAALQDPKAEVRAAAADALGQMNARTSIPRLKEALQDKESSVVLAAAHSLQSFGEPAGYDVYYAILTGKRKSGSGLVADQEKMLRDPKKMAELGFEQGIGFIPFAGMGWSVFKMISKDDVSPVRAAAAKVLASDPDPSSGEALVAAASDKNWIVRDAALESISKRGDPALLERIVPAMTDQKNEVRYTAAAAVVHLSDRAKRRKGHKRD